MPPAPPPVLLILGTDAAGKDYVADFLIRRWSAAGHSIEKRAGGFSAAPADARSSSERKGRWGRFQEHVFIRLFPLLRPLLLGVAGWLLRRDRRRFRPADRPVVVVSHTALRLLAFVRGQVHAPPPLSPALQHALRALRETTRATVIVLDIDPAIRQRRIGARIECGTVDPFDRYMLADRVRAERIEGGLVELAVGFLNAKVIENNDLDAAALEAALVRALESPTR